MSERIFRIGQIVPSSNTTMETEIPAMFAARSGLAPERFTFHSSRMRMKRVSAEELAAMDAESDRCALELSDADVDVMGYACLVAIMAQGKGYHRASETRLAAKAAENGSKAPIVTSAGALIDGIKTLGAKRIALVAPYMKPLTQLVVEYIENEGIEVVDRVALEIPDNRDVARHDPSRLPEIAASLNTRNVDLVVLSACVQMRSLPAVPEAEQRLGKPVVTAAIATVYQMLKALGLKRQVPGAGTLLDGRH
jgi:maleate isomerase